MGLVVIPVLAQPVELRASALIYCPTLCTWVNFFYSRSLKN